MYFSEVARLLALIVSLCTQLTNIQPPAPAPAPIKPPPVQPAPQPASPTPTPAPEPSRPSSPEPPPAPAPEPDPIYKPPHPPRDQQTAPTQVSLDWERAARHYSGGGYGVEFLNSRLSRAPHVGGYPQDRQIVARVAEQYKIPFALLWATYGAESGWGKISWKGGIIPYFGLTFHYPGRGTSGSFVKDARKSAEIWAGLYRQYQGRPAA